MTGRRGIILLAGCSLILQGCTIDGYGVSYLIPDLSMNLYEVGRAAVDDFQSIEAVVEQIAGEGRSTLDPGPWLSECHTGLPTIFNGHRFNMTYQIDTPLTDKQQLFSAVTGWVNGLETEHLRFDEESARVRWDDPDTGTRFRAEVMLQGYFTARRDGDEHISNRVEISARSQCGRFAQPRGYDRWSWEDDWLAGLGYGQISWRRAYQEETEYQLEGSADALAWQAGRAEERAVQVAAGYAHTCLLDATGTVACWGSNSRGQIGDGMLQDRWQPEPVDGIGPAVQISAGDSHTCALEDDGRAWCWGSNSHGQLGDGTLQDRHVPALVTGAPALVQISAGGAHTCGVSAEGQVWCWGHDGYGQAGGASTEPQRVTGISPSIQVEAGFLHTCSITTEDRVECWGAPGLASGEAVSRDFGRRGQSDRSAEGRMPAAEISGVRHLAAGLTGSCALTDEARLWCWDLPSPWMRAVAAEASGTAVAVGWQHACVLLEDRTVTCWGSDRGGRSRPDTGTTEYRRQWYHINRDIMPERDPVYIGIPGLENVTHLTAGYSHTCAITAGDVRCWGWNRFGQIGTPEQFGVGTIHIDPVDPGRYSAYDIL